MGAVFGLLSVGQLACCCTSAACSLCCAACPSCRNSTSTRIMYAVMLLLGTIAACITLSPGLQKELEKVPFCGNSGIMPDVNCQNAVGYLAVYRICFALTCFFALMALIMIGVKTSKDPRSGIQNGFWGIKYLLVIAGIVGAFFIPEGSFGKTWMYFGMIGGFLFIIIQLILIVDFAHSWAENWVGKYEESESKKWYCVLLTATFLNYALAITGFTLLFVYYTKPDECALNKFFLSFNLILCLIVSVVSILGPVQDAQPRSGLLQSSVVTLYVVYLTWSSLSNQPDTNCKLSLLNTISGTTEDPNGSNVKMEGIIGLAIWMCCVLYSSLRTASSSSKITMTEHVLVKDNGAVRHTGEASLVANEETNSHDGGESGGRSSKVWDNEEDSVAYSWSFFHIMFALATLYVMMTLTKLVFLLLLFAPIFDQLTATVEAWLPNSSLETLNANEASVWVKVISSWLCLALYTWTLVAPICLPDRDFS